MEDSGLDSELNLRPSAFICGFLFPNLRLGGSVSGQLCVPKSGAAPKRRSDTD